MLGYDENEIGDKFSEWETRLHPDDRDRALATVGDYLEGRSSDYELEHRLRHKDGSYRCILARGAKVCDCEGRPYRMVGSHLDITQRKHVEQRLLHREARLIAARQIVRRLLPRGTLREQGLVVHGMSLPADYVGGDHYDYGSSGVSGGYNLTFAATRFAAGTWPRGPETLDSCHNCMSHQELGLLWAIQPPETPEEPQGDRQDRFAAWFGSPRASIGRRRGHGGGSLRCGGRGEVRDHRQDGRGWGGGQAERGAAEGTAECPPASAVPSQEVVINDGNPTEDGEPRDSLAYPEGCGFVLGDRRS